MLKFRSMRDRAEPEPARVRARATARRRAASRATTAARASARSCGALSLDELPQLLNVAARRDEPRRAASRAPGVRRARSSSDVYRYGDRHRVKSGMTGWAQVHGLRGQTSLADRVEWDNYYIENWSLWLDVKILLMTVLAVRRQISVEAQKLNLGTLGQACARSRRWGSEQECGCRPVAQSRIRVLSRPAGSASGSALRVFRRDHQMKRVRALAAAGLAAIAVALPASPPR